MVAPITTHGTERHEAHIKRGTVRGGADCAPQCGRVHDPVAQKGARGVRVIALRYRKAGQTLRSITLNPRQYAASHSAAREGSEARGALLSNNTMQSTKQATNNT